MAEINATFVVDAIDLTVVQEDPGITITPDPINLSVYAAGFAPPGGDALTLQFNDNGKLGGAPNTAVSNGNISFGNVGNVKITGGTNGYFLQTDGSGNLTWAQGTANVSGNGTASGANGLIQLSDGTGNFTSGSGFSFDTGTNALAIPGDVVSAGDFSGVDANLSGNITAVDANLSGNITAVDANLSGNLDVAGTFSVGTLTVADLTATGNIDSTSGIFNGDGYGLSNIPAANIVGLSLSSISNGTSNVSIPVADANVIVNVGGQPNRFIISTVGANVEGNLGVTGNADANIINANTANITGNLTANNISVLEYANVKYLVANISAEVAGLTVNSSSIKLGVGSNVGATTVAIGLAAGNANIGSNAVAIGARAGNSDQANNSIILNATGANLTTSTANSFTVKPVRNDSTANILFYNDTTGEITYDSAPATNEISNGTSNVIIASANGNVSFNINAIPDIVVVSTGGINVSGTMDASLFVGDGYGLSNIPGANIVGNASNLTSLTSSGNIDSTSGIFNGDGYGLSNVPYANITGTPTLGNIASINLNGNSSQFLDGTGNWVVPTVTANVANYLALRANNAISIGSNSAIQFTEAIAIGYNAAGNTSFAQDSYAIAIGSQAGYTQQDEGAVALGRNAGYTSQGSFSTALGYQAGYLNQSNIAIAVGLNAGSNAQGSSGIAIGHTAAYEVQGVAAVAIGANAGGLNQSNRAIAIGQEAGSNTQGLNSIAIGAFAGYSNAQANNSIVINASGANLEAPTANAMFVKPVRDVLGGGLPAGFKQVAYNPTTGEFIYYD